MVVVLALLGAVPVLVGGIGWVEELVRVGAAQEGREAERVRSGAVVQDVLG